MIGTVQEKVSLIYFVTNVPGGRRGSDALQISEEVRMNLFAR